MPAKAKLRLVRRRVACERLGGISARTFSRRWAHVFTDPNPAGPKRGRGHERLVYEDELDEAVARGGQEMARRAVLAMRQDLGRL